MLKAQFLTLLVVYNLIVQFPQWVHFQSLEMYVPSGEITAIQMWLFSKGRSVQGLVILSDIRVTVSVCYINLYLFDKQACIPSMNNYDKYGAEEFEVPKLSNDVYFLSI